MTTQTEVKVTVKRENASEYCSADLKTGRYYLYSSFHELRIHGTYEEIKKILDGMMELLEAARKEGEDYESRVAAIS